MAVECWISKLPKLVATSSKQDIEAAVIECRNDLHKQIDKFVTKKETQRRR
jgi:ribosome-associated translation inhibitor RaiA